MTLEKAVTGPAVQVQVQPSAGSSQKIRDIVVLLLLLAMTCVVAATFILEPWTEEELPAAALPQVQPPTVAETKALEAEEAAAKEAEAKAAEAKAAEAKAAEAKAAEAKARKPRTARVTKKAPPPPAASTEPVAIRINTKPFGIPVSVDGGPPQDTPLTGLELKPGKHSLRFLDGDSPFETTITVTSEGKKLWTYKKMNRSIQ